MDTERVLSELRTKAEGKLPRPDLAVKRASFPLRAPSQPEGVEPKPQPSRTGADFETEWARKVPARLARRAIHETIGEPMVRAFANPKVRGVDRLKGLEGVAIFAANHESHLDTPLLLRTIPAPWRHQIFVGAAADYFFGSRLTGSLSALALNAVPIERKRGARRSALAAAGLLEQGWSMLIFPEGGRSPDGWARPFRGGASYLSARVGVPVVPVHLDGTGRIFGKGSRVPKPGSTSVTFGAPMYAREGEDSKTMAARIQDAVAGLADEAGSDWWQARKRSHAGETPPLTGPDGPEWRRSWALTQPNKSTRSTKRRWP